MVAQPTLFALGLGALGGRRARAKPLAPVFAACIQGGNKDMNFSKRLVKCAVR